MVTRRNVLKMAAVGTPMLLASGGITLRSESGESTPSPSTPKWAKTLRKPNQPTKLNAADATATQKALACEIYEQAIAPDSGSAPAECNCVNAAITVWPRIIPTQDQENFKPFMDDVCSVPNPDVDYYQIGIVEVPNVEILQGLSTTIWTYVDHPLPLGTPPVTSPDDEFPGPTFVAERGRPVIIRFVNYLPEDSELALGKPADCAIHGHGFHTPPQSDGYPTDCILPWDGSSVPHSRIYAHPNDNDFPATHWYHDHANHHTARNVYNGLAGFYLLRPHPTAGGRDAFFRKIQACLPSGDHDVAMVFQDRLFDVSGQLFFDEFNHDGRLGDTFLVNGRVQPKLAVEPRKYRFRWLNGSNARFYGLVFSEFETRAENPLPFVQIGTEGALLPRPAVRTIAEIANAERFDVVFDFSGFENQHVYLVNCLQQPDGRGPDRIDLENCTPLVRFDVGNSVTGEDTSCIPPILNPELVRDANGDWAYPGYSVSDVPTDANGNPIQRVFRFDRSHGMWTVNGQIFAVHRNDTVGGVRLCKDFVPPAEVCIVPNPAPCVAGPTSSCENVPGLCTDTSEDGCAAPVPTCSTPAGQTTSATCPPEMWKLINDSGGWAHPVHVHMEEFKLVSRQESGSGNIVPLQPHEVGLKDVFVLHANETITFIATFKDHNNHFDNTEGVLQDYVFHCHNIDHEDMDMMANKRLFTGDAPPADPPECDEGEEN